MSKKKIILSLVILILIAVLVYYFFFFNKEETKFEGESFTTGKQNIVNPVLGFTGKIVSIDPENNILIVEKDEKEIKVIISETTKLIKLTWLSSTDLPEEAKPMPEKKNIILSDFEENDAVLVIAQEDITNKSEISNIDLVQILP